MFKRADLLVVVLLAFAVVTVFLVDQYLSRATTVAPVAPVPVNGPSDHGNPTPLEAFTLSAEKGRPGACTT